MGVRIITEVRQRGYDDPSISRELGMFTDDGLAHQAVLACYREAWRTVVATGYEGSIWFPAYTQAILTSKGWDIWYPDDLNSENPTFYTVNHRLWSQVPSSMQNFTFTLEGDIEQEVKVRI